MNRIIISLAAILILAAASCTQLTQRYEDRHVNEMLLHPDEFALASVFVQNGPATQPAFIAQFAPQGQAALVLALAFKNKDPQDMLNSLVTGPAPKQTSPTDLHIFDRQLIFSIETRLTARLPEPGDRLDNAELVLELLSHSKDVKFSSLSQLSSTYQTINLGSATRTASGTLTGGISATTSPALPISPTLSATGSDSVAETIAFSQQIEQFSAWISPDGRELHIRREGGVGIDLSGLFSIATKVQAARGPMVQVLQVKPDIFFPAAKPSGIDPTDLRPVYMNIVLPDSPRLRAKLSGHYRIRHVIDGAKTLTEGDDKVCYRLGEFKQTFVDLATSEDVISAGSIWALGVDEDHLVQLQVGEGLDVSALLFASHDEAMTFLFWLQKGIVGDHANRSSIGPTTKLVLIDSLGPRPLTVKDLNELQCFRYSPG